MGYLCPYCNHTCFDNGEITTTYYPSHDSADLPEMSEKDAITNAVQLDFSTCPNCGKTAIRMIPYWKNGNMKFSFSYPPTMAIHLPEYIPEAIRSDYEEAVSIVDLSPKASAT